MESVSCLLSDHALIKKKCFLLESILQSNPEGRLVISELTRSLQRLLEEHCRREQPFLQHYRYQQHVYGDAPVATDHMAERQILRAVSQLLLARMKTARTLIILRLSQAIEQLQIQMTRQERLIFPAIDETLLSQETGSMVINETMSVNEVLGRFPTARQVFDELHVNRMEEGADSMDEIAWRHGLRVTDVLEQVRHAVVDSPTYWYVE